MDIITALMNVMNSGRGAASGQVTQSGGSTTTQSGGGGTSSVSSYTSPGDISALQALLGELGGADYQGVLQSIFSQAGGKIPGFMAALGNSMGARSGGNSAINAMLQKLLVETSMQAQQQTADLGLRNATLRANIGGNIAQATRGTHQSQRSVQSANPVRTVTTPARSVTTPNKEPYGIGEMAGLLGLLSAGKGIYGEIKNAAAGDPAASGEISGQNYLSPGVFPITSDGPSLMPMGADRFGQINGFSNAPNMLSGGASFVTPGLGNFNLGDSGGDYNFGDMDWSSLFNFDDTAGMANFDAGTSAAAGVNYDFGNTDWQGQADTFSDFSMDDFEQYWN